MLLGSARVSMRCSERTAMRGRSQDGVPPVCSPTSLLWDPRGFTMFRGFLDRNASELVKKSSRAKGGRVPPERKPRGGESQGWDEQPECMLKYMRIPSTAAKPGPGSGPAWRAEDATRDSERSRFFHKLGLRQSAASRSPVRSCIAATNSWCDQALEPPSTSSVAPVMKAASGLARKATAAATSSGVP
jgi:hypothetical protein